MSSATAQYNSQYNSLPRMRYEPVMPVQEFSREQIQTTQPIPTAEEMSGIVLIPELKGIIFVDKPSNIKLISPEMTGVLYESDRPLAFSQNRYVKKIVNKYIGQPFSMADLTELREKLTRFYGQNDLPVVGIYAPAQDVSNGTIQIVIVEGRVGQVRFEGNQWFSSRQMYSTMNTRPGRRIYESRLNEDINWLNRNPFRDLSVQLNPTGEDGVTDVLVRVKDDFPVRTNVGYTDNGTESTGIERVQAGVTYGNLWNRDHVVNYTYNATPDFEHVQVHSGSYLLPLRNRDTISAFGYYGMLTPKNLPVEFASEGKVWQTSLRYAKLLGITSTKKSRRESKLLFGFDFKETNSSLDFGGTRVADSSAQIAQFVFGYNDVFVRSNKGYLSFDANVFWSPGKISKYNNDEAFGGLRYQSSARYVYGTVNVNAVRFLNDSWQWNSRLNTQWAGERLLQIEEFGLGGEGSVRGYHTYATNSDSGWTFGNELATRFKPLGLKSLLQQIPPYRSVRKVDDEYQLYSFVDMGGGWNKGAVSGYGEKKYEALYGAGLGFRYNFGPWIQIDAAYGWQLKNLSDTDYKDRAHCSIIFSR